MICLISAGFGVSRLANHPVFGGLATQFEHRPWIGLAFWDLVLPGFLFAVGTALLYALAAQTERGIPFTKQLWHSSARSLRLALLAVVVVSVPAGRLQLPVMEVLFHIAFTYFFCFLILQLRLRWQVACSIMILGSHLALFLAFPGDGGSFSKTDNIGAVLDRAVLGSSHPGFYASLNIVPSIVTTLAGAWTAMLLRGRRSQRRHVGILAACAMASVAAGVAISPWVPVIKRIYTLSYTLISTGAAAAIMAIFVGLIEVRGYRRWTFPLTVVGMNCVFAYAIQELLGTWLNGAIAALSGNLTWFGTFAPVAQSCARLAVIWYLCFWLYRRKIFLKV